MESCFIPVRSNGMCESHYRKLSGQNKARGLRRRIERLRDPIYAEAVAWREERKRLKILRARRIKKTSMQLRYAAAKTESLRKNKKFELTFEQFAEVACRPCYYCDGVLGTVQFGKGLDRIDNSRGYEPGNILPCCYACNQTRSNRWTVDETKAMIQAVIRFRQTPKLMVV